MPNCTVPSAMVTAAWVGSITGMPSASSSGRRWRAMPAQPITIASAPSWSRSARPTAIMRASVPSPDAVSATRHLQRPLAGEAVGQAHLAQVAHVARGSSALDRDDAEALGARQRGQHAAFGDAEHGPVRALAADMQAGVGVAGDDEGAGCVSPSTRRRSGIATLSASAWRLDPERAFG